MKNIKEFGMGAFRPELTPNGKHKGVVAMMSPTADADSLFSRNQEMIKAAVSELDLIEDELEEKESLNESVVFEMIQRLIIDVIMASSDLLSIQSLGGWLLGPRFVTNMAQLHYNNVKASDFLAKQHHSNKELDKIREIRAALGRDIVDLFTAILSAFPLWGLDGLFDIVLTQLSNPTSKFIATGFFKALDKIENKTIKTVLYIGSIPLGGPIVIQSLKYIQEIDELLSGLPSNEFHRGGRTPTPVKKKPRRPLKPATFNDEVEPIEDEEVIMFDRPNLNFEDDETEEISIEDEEFEELDDDETVLMNRPRKPRKGKVVWPTNENSILRCRTYNQRKRKFNLIETLERVEEFTDYSGKFAMQLDKMNKATKEREMSIDEFSGVAALGGGPATPLGTDATGKPVSKSKRRKQDKFNRKKSFPYKK